MRLPSKVEIEAANSERNSEFQSITGMSATPTAEQTQAYFAMIVNDREKLRELTEETTVVWNLLSDMQTMRRLTLMASLGLQNITEAALVNAFEWGMRTGYAMGQNDALDLASSLKE